MPDEKKHTDRDLILAKREGYAKAAAFNCVSKEKAMRWARDTYPLPPQTRPRVVRDEYGADWRCLNGVLYEGSDPFDLHQVGHGYFATMDRVRVWADLLANPTEPVPDEE